MWSLTGHPRSDRGVTISDDDRKPTQLDFCRIEHHALSGVRPRRPAIVASSFGRACGRVHGHSAMQIPHDADSAKYGMHLSKSTYQRSTPRTICFCSVIAPGGHEFVHTWHVLQNSSAPNRSGAVAIKGMSVVTPARRTPDPNRRLINDPCLPSSPSPEAMAGGIRSKALAEGPGYALALYPRDRIQFARANEARVPRAYCSPTSVTPTPFVSSDGTSLSRS